MKRRALFAVVALGLGAVAVAAYVLARPAPDAPSDVTTDAPDGGGSGAAPSPALAGRPSDRASRRAGERAAESLDARAGGASGDRSEHSAVFTGRILDADGKPIRGVTVRIAGSGDPLAFAMTDEDGRFSLERPAGASGGLDVSAPGFAERVLAADAVSSGMEIRLAKGWAISGTVRDATTDAPIPEVYVFARPATSPAGGQQAVGRSGADGTFSVAVPDAGTYVLDTGTRYVEGAPGPADDWIGTRIEGVAAGATDLRVRLARGLAIEGKIVDDAGDPPARKMSVEALGRTASGDADYTAHKVVRVANGDFRLPGLKPGRYDLWVGPDADPADVNGAQVSAALVRDVQAGTSGLLVRLSRGFSLAGRLEDGSGGAVLGKGFVYAYREGVMGRSHALCADVPGDGTFRVSPLDETYRYDLLATGFAGRKQGTATGVSVRDTNVVVVLPSAGRIGGRLQAKDGKPVPAGVPIGVVGEGTSARGVGTRVFGYSNADGTFAVDGLADMPFSVEAGGGASGFLGTTVTGVKTGTTDLVLEVSVGVELSGTLVDVQGAPVSTTSLQADDGAHVAAMRPYAQVGADGAFVLRGLRAGRVRLSLLEGTAWIAAGEVEAPGTGVRVVVPAH